MSERSFLGRLWEVRAGLGGVPALTQALAQPSVQGELEAEGLCTDTFEHPQTRSWNSKFNHCSVL